MLFKTRSAAVYGIEAYLVDVEVNISTGGNGQVVIVGLPDTAVRESKNRVLPAIRNNGFAAPYQRIVINLGPADVKKEGSAFDLPNSGCDRRNRAGSGSTLRWYGRTARFD